MQIKSRVAGGIQPPVPVPDSIATFGALSFLAAHCPTHSRFSAKQLRYLFMPAAEQNCARLFQSDTGVPCAALIWARLSDAVSERMIYDGEPPRPDEWNSGPHLWLLDLIAPFGHGRDVARHIARNPPDGPFYYARLGRDGKVKKVFHGDASRGRRAMVRCYSIRPAAAAEAAS